MVSSLALALTLILVAPGQEYTLRAWRAVAGGDLAAMRMLWEEIGADANSPGAAAARLSLEDARHKRYLALGTLPDEPMLREAEELLAWYEPSVHSVYVWLSCAIRHRNADRFVEALHALDEARDDLDSAEWIGSPEDAVRERARWGEVAATVDLRMGLVDRAARRAADLEAALATSFAEKNSWLASQVRQTLVRIDVARMRWGQVKERLERELAAGSFDAAHEGRALYWSGQATYELGREEEAAVERARALLREALAASRDDTLRTQVHLRLARIALDRDELGEAREHLDAARAIEVAAGADISRLGRAHRAVFELRLARREGASTSAEVELLQHWRTLLESWHAAPPRAGGVGYLTYQNHQRILGDVLTVLTEREGPEAAWRELVDAHRAASLVKRRAPELLERPLELPRPGPDEAIWAVLPTLDGTHVFLAHGERVEHVRIEATSEELLRSARALARHVRTSPLADEAHRRRGEAIEELGSGLFGTLFPGSMPSVLSEVSTLTLVGVELLDQVPIEVLGTDATRRLGRTHDITYLPTLALHGRFAGTIEATSPAAGGVSLELVGGSPELWLPSRWAERVSSHYPDGHATIDLGPDASLTHLGEARARVLQLIGHGRLDREQERMATIEIGASRVGYTTLAGLTPAPALVLLTACGSWRGPWRPGDGGVGHLAGACLEAGSQAVVLPAADIEVEATLAWSEVFHWALARGLSPARAAREARLALANSERFGDPFYHSLLHVVGDGHMPIFTPAPGASLDARPDPDERGIAWRAWLAAAGVLLAAFCLGRSVLYRRGA